MPNNIAFIIDAPRESEILADILEIDYDVQLANTAL